MEVWKDIKGYEGLYQVSDLGRVKSLPRIVNYRHGVRMTRGRILKPQMNVGTGYLQIGFLRKTFQIHREVAKSFIETTDYNLQINHINGIKTDNRIENLEWVTTAYNLQHARDIGLVNDYGENSTNSKLKNWQVFYLKYCWDRKGIMKLAQKFGINYKYIYRILEGKTWKHI